MRFRLLAIGLAFIASLSAKAYAPAAAGAEVVQAFRIMVNSGGTIVTPEALGSALGNPALGRALFPGLMASYQSALKGGFNLSESEWNKLETLARDDRLTQSQAINAINVTFVDGSGTAVAQKNLIAAFASVSQGSAAPHEAAVEMPSLSEARVMLSEFTPTTEAWVRLKNRINSGSAADERLGDRVALRYAIAKRYAGQTCKARNQDICTSLAINNVGSLYDALGARASDQFPDDVNTASREFANTDRPFVVYHQGLGGLTAKAKAGTASEQGMQCLTQGHITN